MKKLIFFATAVAWLLVAISGHVINDRSESNDLVAAKSEQFNSFSLRADNNKPLPFIPITGEILRFAGAVFSTHGRMNTPMPSNQRAVTAVTVNQILPNLEARIVAAVNAGPNDAARVNALIFNNIPTSPNVGQAATVQLALRSGSATERSPQSWAQAVDLSATADGSGDGVARLATAIREAVGASLQQNDETGSWDLAQSHPVPNVATPRIQMVNVLIMWNPVNPS